VGSGNPELIKIIVTSNENISFKEEKNWIPNPPDGGGLSGMTPFFCFIQGFPQRDGVVIFRLNITQSLYSWTIGKIRA